MKNILEYLEEKEQIYPDHIAVDDGKQSYTWSRLAETAMRMGTAFSQKTNVRKPVAIVAEKSVTTLSAMFGAVYAGGFYVIVDPSQPLQRIQEILRVLDPELVVVNEKTRNLIRSIGWDRNISYIEEVIDQEINWDALRQIRTNSKETDILYGIFTSGSTGTPKGIVVSHQAVIDFISHFVEVFGFSAMDRIANQAPFDFDVSVKDIYTSLFTGAKLVLIPKEMFSAPPLLLDYLCEKEVTTLIWAVSALSLVTTLKGLDYKVPHSVNKILFSGEVMPIKTLHKWQEALPEARYVNLYGPAEITCNCTYYQIKEAMTDMEKIPIGKAFPGRIVFLLDQEGKVIADAGEVGEICVAGESLSEGYYHNEKETNARFVNRENCEKGYRRFYKTGDLGYYGKDRQLYFSGRKDFQIKHMGHRIELEEIEHAMEQIDGIEKGLCVMDEKRNRLVAFYLGDITPAEIKEEMKQRLPVYMIPHRLVKTEFMPLNKNGKTDRKYFKQKLG